MSRSFKREPVQTDYCRRYTGWAKAHSNRQYRHCRSEKELRAGKSAIHRRYTETWDIREYTYRITRADGGKIWDDEEMLLRSGTKFNRYRLWAHYRFKTKERFMKYWEKWARR